MQDTSKGHVSGNWACDKPSPGHFKGGEWAMDKNLALATLPCV